MKYAARTSVQRKTYSWGEIVVVSKGNRYKAVLHPAELKALKKLKAGDSTTFVDEQRIAWTAERAGDMINLSARGKNLTFALRDIS